MSRLVKPRKVYFGIATDKKDFTPAETIEAVEEIGIIGIVPFDTVRPEPMEIMGFMMANPKIEWLYIFNGYIDNRNPENIMVDSEYEYVTCFGKPISSFDMDF